MLSVCRSESGMPTYEYKCKKCGKLFELFHSINGKPEGCPKCGSKSLEIQISATAGFILKGAGFYQTEYKKTVDKPIEKKTSKMKKAEDKPKGKSIKEKKDA